MSDLKAILEEIWGPGKWVALPAAYIGFIGLVFAIFLSADVGFEVDSTLSIPDYFSIGLLLVMRLFKWIVVIIVLFFAILFGYRIIRLVTIRLYKFIVMKLVESLRERIKQYDKMLKAAEGRNEEAREKRLQALHKLREFRAHEKKVTNLFYGVEQSIRAWFNRTKRKVGGVKYYGISALALALVILGVVFSTAEARRYSEAIRDFAKLSMTGVAPQDSRKDEGYVDTIFNRIAKIVGSLFASADDDINRRLEDYTLRPRLVSIGTKDASYRPMILITEIGDKVILYDLIHDDNRSDDQLYPIRAIKKADVVNMSGVNAARAGAEHDHAPIVDVVISRCPGASSPDGTVATFLSTYIEGDFIVCGSESPRTLRDDDNGLSYFVGWATAVNERLSGISDMLSSLRAKLAALKSVPTNQDADIEAKLEAIREQIAALLARQPPILFQNSHSYFLFPDDEGGGRWSKCKLLTAWNAPEYRIEFANNESLLNERGAHRLQFTPPRAGEGSAPVPGENPWDVLLRLLETWIKEVEAYQAQNPGEGAVLFLIGQASENGNVAHNLRLTERRAEGVRKILVRQFAERLKGARLHPFERGYVEDKYAIIAIGEGESAMAPESFLASTENRRVDARFCFLDPEIGTARAPGANTSPGE